MAHLNTSGIAAITKRHAAAYIEKYRFNFRILREASFRIPVLCGQLAEGGPELAS
jgi:hypothetical protein